MPTERLSMRKVREVLRLRHALGLSCREISKVTGIGKTAVGEYVRRAEVIGITWPVPDDVDDTTLERRLFICPDSPRIIRDEIDWVKVHHELKQTGVTLLLIWQEYRAREPNGLGYSRFCDLYGEWRRKITRTMRQTHVAGEKLFVDFAGPTIPVFDPTTGESRPAHVFVAALGASNFTYAEARWSEGLCDWIDVHVNALTVIGGVPKAVVCDNLKAGVTHPSRYEPGINRTYQELADHYGFVVLPTRVRKPRDKAKVEVAVLLVERWVLARVRHRRFFSLDELNAAIRECVNDLNIRVMRKLGKSRQQLFEVLDRPALSALPNEPYRYAEWKKYRVGPDYHVEIDGHYYSVPSRLVGEHIELRVTTTTVEALHKGIRVASHARSAVKNRNTTVQEHMPSSHRRYAEWTPARILEEAAKIGPCTLALAQLILNDRPHPEQGFRSCLGILHLQRTYGTERLEAACRRGNEIGARSYSSIASILRHGLDRVQNPAPESPPIQHANIRGRAYYH